MISPELQQLKELAAKLGVEHSPNIGVDTLKGKIRDFCEQTGTPVPTELDTIGSEKSLYPNEQSATESKNTTSSSSQLTLLSAVHNTTEKTNDPEITKLSKLTFAGAAEAHAKEEHQSAYRRAMKLVRCRISCNNPNKRSYQGEIFCVRNKTIDMCKKMVPFNVPTHVPQIILNMIKEKQLQQFTSKRLPNGIESKTVKLVPEYNIEILPPLTTEEFNAIRQKQLAEGEA